MASQYDQDDNEDIEGSHFTIKFCEGAEASFGEALGKTGRKSANITGQINVLLIRLSNNETMATNTIVKEALLPDGSHFKAIKKIPIRCYFWKSKNHKSTMFVSHFVFKNKGSLDKRDIQKVVNNWNIYEPKGEAS